MTTYFHVITSDETFKVECHCSERVYGVSVLLPHNVGRATSYRKVRLKAVATLECPLHDRHSEFIDVYAVQEMGVNYVVLVLSSFEAVWFVDSWGETRLTEDAIAYAIEQYYTQEAGYTSCHAVPIGY